MRQANQPLVRRPYILTLIIAQVVCVAVGLSFQHGYIASSIHQSLEQDGRTRLVAPAQQAAESLGRLAATTPLSQNPDLRRFKQVLLEATAGRDYGLALVDADWQLLATAGPQGQVEDELESITWVRASGPMQSRESIRGSIKAAGGLHVAVAMPLSDGKTYVVAHRSVEGDAISASKVPTMLWTASAISMVWTCGLLAVTLYMIVSYFHGGSLKQQKPHEGEALKQAQDLLRTQETVIFGLAKLSESRDPETGDHLDRIAYYSTMLASALRQHPDFCDTVTASYVHLIGISSALHDIGKVGVEDAILRKPSSLTQQERTRMKEHTRVGAECLREIERRLGTSNFLEMAREIASSHHERWNGTGYPLGLAGEQIPLAARIVAIADVYDALNSKRVYKEALPHEQCVAMIAEESGRHFDPRLVEVFLKMESKFEQVSHQFRTLKSGSAPRAAEKLDERLGENICLLPTTRE